MVGTYELQTYAILWDTFHSLNFPFTQTFLLVKRINMQQQKLSLFYKMAAQSKDLIFYVWNVWNLIFQIDGAAGKTN